MDLDKAIYGRRSIRKYSEKMVENEKIKQIIEAGIWAPSACNFQQWKFIVIDNKDILMKLYKAGAASFVKDTKQAILVLYNNQTDNTEYCDYLQSASAAIENMLLKAYSIGVGTCWVNNLPNKSVVRRIFNIPRYEEPIALITLGYPIKESPIRARKKDVDSYISHNMYKFMNDEHKKESKVFIKRLARKIYKIMPFKTKLMRIAGRFEKKFDE